MVNNVGRWIEKRPRNWILKQNQRPNCGTSLGLAASPEAPSLSPPWPRPRINPQREGKSPACSHRVFVLLPSHVSKLLRFYFLEVLVSSISQNCWYYSGAVLSLLFPPSSLKPPFISLSSVYHSLPLISIIQFPFSTPYCFIFGIKGLIVIWKDWIMSMLDSFFNKGFKAAKWFSQSLKFSLLFQIDLLGPIWCSTQLPCF